MINPRAEWAAKDQCSYYCCSYSQKHVSIILSKVVMNIPYLSPCREASEPSFVHASCKTSARCLAGVVFMTARRADESRTTTWEAIQRKLKPGETSCIATRRDGCAGGLICWCSRTLCQAGWATLFVFKNTYD